MWVRQIIRKPREILTSLGFLILVDGVDKIELLN